MLLEQQYLQAKGESKYGLILLPNVNVVVFEMYVFHEAWPNMKFAHKVSCLYLIAMRHRPDVTSIQ